MKIYDKISQILHFNPDLDLETPLNTIVAFRKQIEQADGIIICTPEYVFGLSGSLKNAFE